MEYSILIVDRHAMIREILCDYFSADPECHASFAVSNISSAIDFLRTTSVQLVVLDYDLGNESVFTFFEVIQQNAMKVPALVLSDGVNQMAVSRLLEVGVAGVVWKTCALKDFAECVRDAARGLTWRESERLLSALQNNPRCLASYPLRLSERQTQVLRGLVAGFANKEIAAQLGVSEASVKCTVQQIFGKTGTHSRTELLRIVFERFPEHFVTAPQGKRSTKQSSPNPSLIGASQVLL